MHGRAIGVWENVPLALSSGRAYLLVFLQPSLQPLCVGLSLPQGTQLLLALVQPGAQAAVLLEELGQLVPQNLRFPQAVLEGDTHTHTHRAVMQALTMYFINLRQNVKDVIQDQSDVTASKMGCNVSYWVQEFLRIIHLFEI